MLLTADIGNTQTAIGVYEGGELREHWAFATRSTDTADELHLNLSGLFGLSGLGLEGLDGCAIACVVPALTDCWTEVTQRICGARPVVVGPGVKTGLPMRYDNPAEVGADRVADAIAAIDLVGAPAMVVDLGTATNIEVVDREGSFRGGIIAPGMNMGAMALFRQAARLPQVDLNAPGHVVGTNTVDAIRSGLLYGEVARIDGLVRMVVSELGYDMPVIATGGLAGHVCGLSTTITRREPLLTLHGLRLIYERNR